MYAAPFLYERVASWQEAVAALAAGDEDARVIAGGQSLVPMMMLRVSEPPLLVDVSAAAQRTIDRVDGTLVLSALVRHADLVCSPEVRTSSPVLADGAGHIGNVRVRHRGTLGGSIAHGEPTAELACIAVVLGATITVLGPGGERSIPASDFFVTHFTTALEPGEIVTGITVPVDGPGVGSGFEEMARRIGDFAMAEAAARVALDGDGRCTAARVVLSAIADRPIDVSELDCVGSLVGSRLNEDAAAAAGRAAAEKVEIGPSTHGSESYRRRMVAVLVKRALVSAADRARGNDKETAR
jgi:carbon-monoxide dehydrogenase medium subunit